MSARPLQHRLRSIARRQHDAEQEPVKRPLAEHRRLPLPPHPRLAGFPAQGVIRRHRLGPAPASGRTVRHARQGRCDAHPEQHPRMGHPGWRRGRQPQKAADDAPPRRLLALHGTAFLPRPAPLARGSVLHPPAADARAGLHPRRRNRRSPAGRAHRLRSHARDDIGKRTGDAGTAVSTLLYGRQDQPAL